MFVVTSSAIFRVVAMCVGLCIGLGCELAAAQAHVEPVPVELVPVQAPVQAPVPAGGEPARSPAEPSGQSQSVGDASGAIEQSGPVAPLAPLMPTAPLAPLPLELLGSKQVRIVVGSPAFTMHMGSQAAQRIVEGSPYCAEAETESVTRLADGKPGAIQIVVTRLCRDAQGRTRQEHSRGGEPLVFLEDPVQKARWVLDVTKKTATRTPVGLTLGSSSATLSQSKSASWSNAKVIYSTSTVASLKPASMTSGADEARAQPEHSQRIAQELAQWARELGQQVRARLGDGPPLQFGVPNLNTTAISIMAAMELSSTPRGEGVSKSLGQREIDGIRANGELTTWVIESAKEPIRITREVWTSPDLMLTVLSKDVDPRRGEHNYRLKNVNRNHPSPELFRVPADYAERNPSAK